MIWEITLKEIRHNATSFKFQLATITVILLVTASFYTMWGDYKHRLARFSPTTNSPWEVSIAPNPLSIFVKGLDAMIGRSFTSNWFSRIIWGSDPMEEQAAGFILTPDLLFLTTVVMTLIAIFFSFDLINGERETGTLQLLLSNVISRDAVILGKALGAMICILVPFVGSVALGVIFLMLGANVPLDLSDLGRLGVLLLASVAVISSFFLLGTCGSIVFSRSATCLIALLFLWAVLVFGIPNISPLIAEKLVGVPSQEFLLQKRSQTWIKPVVEREWTERRGDRYSGQRVREMFEMIVSENRRLFEDYQQKLDRLVAYTDYTSMLSPVGCYQVVATSIMGTSPRDYAHLKRALARYYYSLPIEGGEGSTPPFSYHRRSLRASFDERAVLSSGILVFTNVILFLLAYTLFLKADVRRV